MNSKCYRQTHADNVDGHVQHHRVEGCQEVEMKSQAQHDPVHYEIDSDAIKHAKNYPVLCQERELATCQEEDGANHKGVKEMDGEAEGCGGKTSFVRVSSQQSAGD